MYGLKSFQRPAGRMTPRGAWPRKACPGDDTAPAVKNTEQVEAEWVGTIYIFRHRDGSRLKYTL